MKQLTLNFVISDTNKPRFVAAEAVALLEAYLESGTGVNVTVTDISPEEAARRFAYDPFGEVALDGVIAEEVRL
jgi:hypothetical protein